MCGADTPSLLAGYKVADATVNGATVDNDGDDAIKAGPFLVDGKVLSVNDQAEREAGEEIVNLKAVADRLGAELRGGKAYSPQRLRAIIASGWLGLWRKNVGDDEDPYYSWFVCDGKGGRPDTVADYINAVNDPNSGLNVRSGGGSITVSKLPDGAAKLPDGVSAPDGMTVAELLNAIATANGLRFAERTVKVKGEDDAKETAASAARSAAVTAERRAVTAANGSGVVK